MWRQRPVRRAAFAFGVIFASAVRCVAAQDAAPAPHPDTTSIDRVRAALETQHGGGIFGVTTPEELDWGVLRFVHPDSPSQFIAVHVPVGELATRFAKHISTVRHDRAEAAAHAEVVKALAEFERMQLR